VSDHPPLAQDLVQLYPYAGSGDWPALEARAELLAVLHAMYTTAVVLLLSTKGNELKIDHADRTPRETLEETAGGTAK
jgi:hypothetical protein